MDNGHDAFLLNEEYGKLISWRWPDGKPKCPKCGHEKLYFIAQRKKFNCAGCRHQFGVLTGTVHHNAKVGVKTLLQAMDLIAEDPDLTAAELSRVTSMSYRGAYYLAARIKGQAR